MTVYVRSISNYRVALNLEPTNWDPVLLSNYTSLTWDYNGMLLEPGDIIEVTLTLSIDYSPTLVKYLLTELFKTQFRHKYNCILKNVNLNSVLDDTSIW